MPSLSLQRWFTERAAALDEIERAHRALRGSGPGVRTAMLQINQAYSMMLSAQFQGYCRDFHAECADFLTSAISDPYLRGMVQENLAFGRKLDRGNPSPGNIGADFKRFLMNFWPLVLAHRTQNIARRNALEELNGWRNAIAASGLCPGHAACRSPPIATGSSTSMASSLRRPGPFFRRRIADVHPRQNGHGPVVKPRCLHESAINQVSAREVPGW